jgi:transmembrane sensor
MQNKDTFYAALVKQYLLNELTVNQVSELFDWIEQEPDAYQRIMDSEEIRDLLETKGYETHLPSNISDSIRTRLIGSMQPTMQKAVHRIHFLKTAWFRSVAAAILILIIGSVAYLWKTQRQNAPLVTTNPAPMRNDVAAPQMSRAMIILGNGKNIVLDSAAKGLLAMQGSVQLRKQENGSVVYSGNTEKPEYNTLMNPRGSKPVSLLLADGSKVWLNAESSVRYPTAFSGGAREVEITGEAYFEIAHDPAKPFIVTKGITSITVLGTHFNVNAFDDEETIKVTLLEGSVKVSSVKTKNSKTIKPGEQVIVSRDAQLQTQQAVDLDEVMAWKNGMFSMHKADVGAIMRQVARWYDVEVSYEKGIPKGTISGEVPKNLSLSEVLKVYQYSGVHFSIEGKKIIVKP